MAKPKAFALPLACGTLAVLGIAATSAPSYAGWPKSVRGAIYARAISTSGGTTGAFVPGTDFRINHYYRFDFGITENNTSTVNTSSVSQWGPNNPSGTNLTAPLYSYFGISKCASTTLPTNCTSSVAIPGVVSGTWDSSTTYGSGTDLQTFGVGLGETPSLNMAFGATDGTTGLTTKFGGVANQTISNVVLGCDIQAGCNGSGLAPYSLAGATWGAIGGSISNLTASNIISNLALTLDEPMGYMNGTASSACTTSSSPNVQCDLAINISGSSPGTIFFNVNSVEFTYVPGPLPISAAFIAFGYSRKLRSRLKTAG
ncbi:MAG: hypothetical protein ACK5N0_03010 [Synechococcaceae cyanobacterium]